MRVTSCIVEVLISFSFQEEKRACNIGSSVCVRLAVIFILSYDKNS